MLTQGAYRAIFVVLIVTITSFSTMVNAGFDVHLRYINSINDETDNWISDKEETVDVLLSNLFLLNKDLVEIERYQPILAEFAGNSELFIVQFKGPIYEEWIYSLRELGLTILAYLPDYAFIVRGEINALISSPEMRELVDWVGEFNPIYKVQRELLDFFLTGNSDLELDVNIKVFDSPQYFERVLDDLSSIGVELISSNFDSNIVLASLKPSSIMEVAVLPEVEWLDRYFLPISFMDNIRNYTGVDYLDNLGINGTGIVGEVKDNGFDQTHPDFTGQILGTDGTIFVQNHGTSTFGIVFGTGNNDNQATGMLPDGKGVICSWSVPRATSIKNLVNNWGGLFQSNSWSSGALDGNYTSISQEDDGAIFDYNITMLYAAGNSNFGVGTKTLTQDSAAKNVISVGGVSHKNTISMDDDQWQNGGAGSTPSQGPALDGRIKPDICGPFDSIYTTDVVGSSGYSTTNYYSSFGGTSGATPVTAGTVGLIYRLYMDDHFDNNAYNEIPAPSTVKAILIADAYQYSLTQAARHQQGWGTPDLENIYDIGSDHFIVNETTPLKTAESATFAVIPTGGMPLKISLVWTDYKGTPGAKKALVNDLDLKVTGPDGKVYYGNYDLNNSLWSQDSSTPKFDRLNNVENVFIENATRGKWTIQVIGANVPMDGDIRTGATDQSFALVVSNVNWEPHDLTVTSIKAPKYAEPGTSTVVNATIFNLGTSDESSVKVNLTVNGTVVNTTTISLLSNVTGKDIELSWKPTTGIHDVRIEVTPKPGENITDNNNLSVTVIAEPDVSVRSVGLPDYGIINEQVVINATIENQGNITLNNINVTLSVNDTIVNWTIVNINKYSLKNVSLNWTSTSSGWKTIKVEALPVLNETMVSDNNKTASILIAPSGPRRVFVLDSWGTDNPAAWNYLNTNWMNFGIIPLVIDYTTFKDVPITYSNLAISKPDVLVISSAWASFSGWEFSDSEIADITKYVKEGAGLVITAFTFWSSAPNNYKFAPLVGIADSASTSFGFATNVNTIETFINNHSLFNNLNDTFTLTQTTSITPADGFWDDGDMGAGVLLAGNYTTNRNAMIENHGVYYFSNWLENGPGRTDHQLLYNAFSTSNYTTYDIDVSLRNYSADVDDIPFGDTITFNASVHNIGQQVLNNINVTIYINETLINFTVIPTLAVGSYINLTMNWSANILGLINAKINVTPFAGENYTNDNFRQFRGRILANPEISLFPGRLEVDLNETENSYRILQINNTGLNNLSFSISSDEPWLNTNISAGEIVPGGWQLVNITYSAGSLTKGHYYGNLTITCNDIDEPVVRIPVHLIVYGQLRYIKITPENFTTNTDTIVQYSSLGYNMTNGEVSFNKSWAVTDMAGYIAANGLYYPGKRGNWTVYCNESDGAVSNFTTVNVKASGLDHIDILPGSWSGTADDSITFTATGRNASNGIVPFSPVWDTDDPWGTITNGLYLPGMAGNWRVFCTNFRGTVVASVLVTVTPGALLWIDITPPSWTGNSSETEQFQATGFDKNDNEVSFTNQWSTTDPLGTITSGGFYTAGKAGAWAVKCENNGQTITKSIPVTVTPSVLDSISITPSEVNLTADESVTFAAVGLDLKGNEITIAPSWDANGGGTISNSTGLFEASEAGHWFVYANYSGKSSFAYVNITFGALVSIEVTPAGFELKPGDQRQFYAEGFDSHSNTRPVAPTWAVNGGGIINTATGLLEASWAGTWIVYANESGISGQTTFTVSAGDLNLIIITPHNADVVAGESINFDAEGRDSMGNSISINPIWVVDGGGIINPGTGIFSAEKAGSWTVTAGIGDIISTTTVFVLPGAIDRIGIEPTSPEITTDETLQFNASGYDFYKNKIAIMPDWSVAGKGSIDSDGLFKPTTVGRWKVTAEYNGISSSVMVLVNLGKLTSMWIEPTSATVEIGGTIAFDVTAADASDNSVKVFANWDVNGSAGFIGSDGIFNARGPGIWNLTANYQELQAFATVTVIKGDDTDSDGMSDAWEIEHGLDPLRGSDADEDLDSDALSNLQEYQNGTDPTSNDSDGDTIDDYWELLFGLDPLFELDADDDEDSDGFTNLEEYNAKTDPTDPTNHPPEKGAATGETGIDRALLMTIIAIVVIIIICIIIGIWLYSRRKDDDDRVSEGKKPESDIIDVDFEMKDDEFDEDEFEFELDEDDDDEFLPPPPPPPPSKVTFKQVEDEREERGKRKSKSKRKDRKAEPKRKPRKKKPMGKVGEPPEGVDLKQHECPRCSEPIKVPYGKDTKINITCSFCDGKSKIDNPYLKKSKPAKPKSKKPVKKKEPEPDDSEVSWDDESEDEISWD